MMNVGVLWFDNDPKKALEQKIAEAQAYYQTKYGRASDMCLVPSGDAVSAGITRCPGDSESVAEYPAGASLDWREGEVARGQPSRPPINWIAIRYSLFSAPRH